MKKLLSILLMTILAGTQLFAMTLEEISAFMMGYYKNPQPEKITEMLTSMDKHFGDSQAMPTLGFCGEIFFKNPEKLAEWDGVIAKLENKNFRACLEILRKAMTETPNFEQKFFETAFGEPDFAWGAYFASGDLKYPREVLRYAVEPEEPGTMDLMKHAAQWSILALGERQGDAGVMSVLDDFYKNGAIDDLNRFFAGMDLEFREARLGKERAALLDPPKSKEEK